MCGIAGFLACGGGQGRSDPDAALRAMSDALAHRGPDDIGAWRDGDSGIWLGFRRLSILDLSQAGHQPMASHCGRYVLAFNGEIYNHLEIRRALAGVRGEAWRGHADSETLLAAVSHWGIKAALTRAVGMFAFAIWDRELRVLTLARDRLGEKPLYYGWQGDHFLFGSELKALKAHPAFRAGIDRDALTLLLRHSYVPAPYSIHSGIRKLEPGMMLQVSAAARDPSVESFWSVRAAVEAGRRDPFRGTAVEAVDALESLLAGAIGQQMVADVPLGAFLSGGVDSSAVVALMQAQSSRSVKTFAIGFDERGYDEAVHANAVARHLGTDHTELYVSAEDARAVIPRLPAIYDEPFADSSQIPTFLVAQLARAGVTVSLSGDGGDELFGGYHRYDSLIRLWRLVGWAPGPLRRGLASALKPRNPASRIAGKLDAAAAVLAAKRPEEVYHRLVSHWKDPASVVSGSREPPTVLTDRNAWMPLPDLLHRGMYLDQLSYLPGDILAKVDRAAMAVSLETRVPLLDHRVVEFAWRLPVDYLVREGQTKWILRQVLYRHAPRALFERPKQGFGVPIGAWLRGPLRAWAEALLEESRLRREGFFDPGPIRRKWAEHSAGTQNWQAYLWDVLMFQAWLEAQRASP